MEKSPIQIQIEKERREKLMREKPYAMEKLFKYDEKRARGEATPIVEIIYDHKCNMHCSHCMNSNFTKKSRSLTVEDIARIAEEMDNLGLAQFNISGGEPLFFDDLDEVVKAMNPKKFHICMSTNGYFLDEKMADHLKEIGVDKVKISVDSIDKDTYAKTRMSDKYYEQTFKALFNAKNAGLQVVVQTVISHQTCRTENTERLAAFCQENLFNMDIMVAKAMGAWEGKTEVLIDEEDAAFLLDLHKKYPVLHRDTYPTYGDKEGRCGVIERLLMISKYGDVMPCGFIPIAIGNIFEDRLIDIINRGRNIKAFANVGQLCTSGENRHFINKYLSKTWGKSIPSCYKDIFTEDEDYFDKDKR